LAARRLAISQTQAETRADLTTLTNEVLR